MDIGLEGLLQIIGELEVNKRVMTDELEKHQAKINQLEQENIAFKNVGQKPTPISSEIESNAEDNLQASQD